MNGLKLKRLFRRTIMMALALLAVLYCVFPFYYAVLTSLKSGTALFEVTYWPTSFSLANYRAVFTEQPFGRNILNSVVVSTVVVFLSLVVGLLAAYALGRVRFLGRRPMLLSILATSMFPQGAVLSGMFELVRFFGLYNQLSSLCLTYLLLTMPFTIWVLTTFMRELPMELEEAARLDGAGLWLMLRRILLPLAMPAVVTTGLLALIMAWNEFLFALTFTVTNDRRTVPVAIAMLGGASEHELPWGNIMAASVVVTVPLIVLVLIFQGRIVSGLTQGAVKG